MTRLAANADDYTVGRVGIFFPANNSTPADGNLTGQCVTLVKWFMAEMSEVPSPFAARGDARYVGQNLVAQGHADAIPAGQQRRGDIVTYEYGTYGHIGVLLSGNRFFQENANIAGAQRRVVDGDYVYSSTIVNLYGSLGGVAPKFYRLKTYSEGDNNVAIIQDNDAWRGRAARSFQTIRGRGMGAGEFEPWIGQDFLHLVEALEDNQEADAQIDYANWGRTAKNDNWQGQIEGLQNERDTVNYPKINAATQGLGLPIDASADDITKQIAVLDKEIADLNAQIAQGNNEAALQLIINGKNDEIKQLTDNLTKAFKEEDDLKAQLAATKPDALNGVGAFLMSLVKSFGIKK